MSTSVIILNWKRRNNVRRIVTELTEERYVSQIVVVNNNPSDTLHTSEIVTQKAVLVNNSRDLGLTTRFAFPLLCDNDAVLIIDDDNAFKPGEFEKLYSHWLDDPDILHGKHGRRPRLKDNSYADDIRGEEECPIVLTRVMMMHRKYASLFFLALERFRGMLEKSKPKGNGEDILMSYTVMKQTGRNNRVHKINMQELPAPEAIHGRWGGHMKYRTNLMRACQEWINE